MDWYRFRQARYAVEGLYTLLFIHRQDHSLLTAAYYEQQFKHCEENMERVGMWLGSKLLHDLCV